MENGEGWLCVLGLAFAVVGYFGPWVPHKTAALTVTGLELAEFAKFFPQVQGGAAPIARELFYAPLVAALILVALLASRSATRFVRLGVPALAAALLVVALLPYPVVNAVRQALTTRSSFTVDPQYAGQLALVVAGAGCMLLAPVARRFPRRLPSILVAFLALVGIAPALWQFVLLRPLVVALYGKPFGLGWGLIVCVAGFALLLLSGIVAAARVSASP